MAKRGVTPWAIKAGRELRDMSRADLATRLTEVTGQEWSVSKVNHLENGAKRVDTALLVALSEVLDLPYRFLLEGPIGSDGQRTVTVQSALSGADLGILNRSDLLSAAGVAA